MYWFCWIFATLSSSLESHTHLVVVVKLCMYYAQRPRVSSKMYPSTMFPYGLHMFWTYPFKFFMACLMGYIQRKCTGPHMLSSSIKWTTRCVIKSNNLGGNTFSRRYNVVIILTFKTWYVDGSYTLVHMSWKILQICKMDTLGS